MGIAAALLRAGLALALVSSAPAVEAAYNGVPSDVRGSGTLNAASTSSVVLIPLNGSATVGLTFTGLTASGATVTFYESNSGATPASPIASLNAATGVSSTTRTTDGDTRIAVNGHTTLAVQVTTAGTGTITVGYNVSAAPGIVDVRAPLPPGTNSIGTTVDTIANGADVTLGSNTDAASCASGNSAMACFRQLHADLLASTPASVSSAAPTYTSGTTQPLSLTTAGALRVDGSGVTQTVQGTVSAFGYANASSTVPSYAAGNQQLSQTLSGQLRALATTDQTTHGTTDKVAADLYVGGAPNSSTAPVTASILYGAVGQYNATLQTAGGAANTYLQTDNHSQLKTVETGSDNLLVGIVPNAGSGATCSTASTSTGCIAKTSQGNVYRVQATAPTAPSAQQYLVCVNSASVPSASAAITAVDWQPFNSATTAGATAVINWGPGPPSGYSTGIACVISTSLTTYTAGTASIIGTWVR